MFLTASLVEVATPGSRSAAAGCTRTLAGADRVGGALKSCFAHVLFGALSDRASECLVGNYLSEKASHLTRRTEKGRDPFATRALEFVA